MSVGLNLCEEEEILNGSKEEKIFWLTLVVTVAHALTSMMNSHGLMMTCLILMQPKLVKS